MRILVNVPAALGKRRPASSFGPTALMLALAVSAAVPQTSAAQSVRLKSELSCQSYGTGPTLDCRVQLRDPAGQPVTGAKVSFGATMPSMPMAHSVKPVAARAEPQAGQYAATLVLEMMGGWAVEIDVAAPYRDRLVHNLLIEPCGADRCPAKAVSAAAVREHPQGHKHDQKHRH